MTRYTRPHDAVGGAGLVDYYAAPAPRERGSGCVGAVVRLALFVIVPWVCAAALAWLIVRALVR